MRSKRQAAWGCPPCLCFKHQVPAALPSVPPFNLSLTPSLHPPLNPSLSPPYTWSLWRPTLYGFLNHNDRSHVSQVNTCGEGHILFSADL